MRGHSIFTSKVNFFVSILFVASFGIFTTSVLLRFAELEDPITGSLAATMSDTNPSGN